jgi:hypothetical protein
LRIANPPSPIHPSISSGEQSSKTNFFFFIYSFPDSIVSPVPSRDSEACQNEVGVGVEAGVRAGLVSPPPSRREGLQSSL